MFCLPGILKGIVGGENIFRTATRGFADGVDFNQSRRNNVSETTSCGGILNYHELPPKC